jgi:hypothetical protein
MNQETRNEQTTDPLSRWWWPGQWLRIVYAVWVDQAWYWQNVRPRLHGRSQGWGIFVQVSLGTWLAVAIGELILNMLLLAIGSPLLDWQPLSTLLIGGELMAVSFATTDRRFGLAWGVPIMAAWGMSLIILEYLLVGLARGLANIIGDIAAILIAIGAAGIVLGASLGIAVVVINGTGFFVRILGRGVIAKLVLTVDAIMLVVMLVIMGKGEIHIAVTAASMLGGGVLGLYVGERWATRQT